MGVKVKKRYAKRRFKIWRVTNKLEKRVGCQGFNLLFRLLLFNSRYWQRLNFKMMIKSSIYALAQGQ